MQIMEWWLFGGRVRSLTLYAIAALKDSYATEIALVVGAHRPNIQRLLGEFESAGVIVSRGIRVRRVSLNPRFAAARELSALLDRLIETDPAFLERLALARRRPRRPGKSLEPSR